MHRSPRRRTQRRTGGVGGLVSSKRALRWVLLPTREGDAMGVFLAFRRDELQILHCERAGADADADVAVDRAVLDAGLLLKICSIVLSR